MKLEDCLFVSKEVREALDNNRPVVALESTIISHGMPYPKNVETALSVEKIIRDNGAALLTSAEHFVKAMGWEGDASLAKARSEGIERTIFPDLTPEEAKVVETLGQRGDMHLNMLATQTGIAVNRLTSVLFELEMKGVLRTMAGGMYHLMPQ